MKNNICAPEPLHGCTGCGICSALCPQEAIAMAENEEGFYRPVVDESKCSHCGLCKKACYRFDEAFLPKAQETHDCCSAIHKDPGELAAASSGAVSIELMRQCLRWGYWVVGVAYDTKSHRALTKIAREEDELEQFKGSKYFQSNTAVFRDVLQDRSEQKYAIFGTPCQIYAFSKAAEVKNRREKYLLVDIFCHGCPSLKLWDKYLERAREKYRVQAFDAIRFRSKTHGWHEFCFDFIKDGRSHSCSKFSDPFYELFFSMDLMNEACYDCVARSSVEKADLRMGDFWGWQFDTDRKGVSAVVLQSSRGKALFEAVRDRFETRSFDFSQVIAAQSYGKRHSYDPRRREQTLAALKSEQSMDEIHANYLRSLPKGKRVKRLAKQLAKIIPQGLYANLRRRLHKK